MDPAWRNQIQIGIIKSTFECGNTSVSMGLAVSYFAKKHLNKDNNKVVGFLNCGTGGIKFQLYTCLQQKNNDRYRVALVAEFKPGKHTTQTHIAHIHTIRTDKDIGRPKHNTHDICITVQKCPFVDAQPPRRNKTW